MMAPASREDLKEIGKAVVIATLTAVVAGFVQWGIEELKERCKRKPEDEEKDDEQHRL